jgi:hypothetical protein
MWPAWREAQSEKRARAESASVTELPDPHSHTAEAVNGLTAISPTDMLASRAPPGSSGTPRPVRQARP